MAIQINNIIKGFGEKQVLKGIDFEFQQGKVNMIIGASGSGKSVMLKCIVGLMKPDGGEVLYDGMNFHTAGHKEVRKIRNNLGMLFQYSALFDSMNVEENVGFPLRLFTKEDKHVTTVVLPRDKLVGVLNQFILENYADRIQLNYGYEVRPVDWNAGGANSVLVSVSRCEDEIARLNPSSVKTSYEEQPDVLCDTENFSLLQASFLIAADGTVRTFANSAHRQALARVPR